MGQFSGKPLVRSQTLGANHSPHQNACRWSSRTWSPWSMSLWGTFRQPTHFQTHQWPLAHQLCSGDWGRHYYPQMPATVSLACVAPLHVSTLLFPHSFLHGLLLQEQRFSPSLFTVRRMQNYYLYRELKRCLWWSRKLFGIAQGNHNLPGMLKGSLLPQDEPVQCILG